jgi:hypothetical protein
VFFRDFKGLFGTDFLRDFGFGREKMEGFGRRRRKSE